ncbi:hypothetical protein HDU98_003954 [Podochytrium sp. JEL0797]|nr:hypothetical protein HDU98_003954 [Podochytrium sp. JEL0797]
MTNFFDVKDVHLVDADGSPAGQKHQLVWNPPAVQGTIPGVVKVEEKPADSVVGDEAELGGGVVAVKSKPVVERVPAMIETVTLCTEFMKNEIRFICFVKTRNACELLLQEFHNRIDKRKMDTHFRDKVMSYRGGYSKEERREIEQKMFNGELLGIIATNALELGVDIGVLDVVVHLGFPHTMASYKQQLGRAGRRKKDSASIMVFRALEVLSKPHLTPTQFKVANGFNKVDQFYAESPQDLFNGSPDTIHIPFSCHDIVNLHLHCAASEIAITESEYQRLLASVKILPPEFVPEPALLWDPKHLVYFAARKFDGNPAREFQIRDSEQETEYRVIDVETNRDVELVESTKAFFSLFDGAIFLHRGKSYFILDVDHTRKVSRARPVTVPYITKIKEYREISPYATHSRQHLNPHNHHLLLQGGLLKVTTISTGYRKLHPLSKRVLDTVEMGNETNRVTLVVPGFWWDDMQDLVGEAVAKAGFDVGESVHAAGHAVLKAVVGLEEGVKGLDVDCHGILKNGSKRLS